jgi:hypothetical protein
MNSDKITPRPSIYGLLLEALCEEELTKKECLQKLSQLCFDLSMDSINNPAFYDVKTLKNLNDLQFLIGENADLGEERLYNCVFQIVTEMINEQAFLEANVGAQNE